MAEQADFVVKNNLKDAVKVSLTNPDKTRTPATAVAGPNGEKFFIGGTDVSMLIQAPAGIDTSDCYCIVKSPVDLTVRYSKTEAAWAVKIEPNKLSQDLPITVNITIGSGEPI